MRRTVTVKSTGNLRTVFTVTRRHGIISNCNDSVLSQVRPEKTTASTTELTDEGVFTSITGSLNPGDDRPQGSSIRDLCEERGQSLCLTQRPQQSLTDLM